MVIVERNYFCILKPLPLHQNFKVTVRTERYCFCILTQLNSLIMHYVVVLIYVWLIATCMIERLLSILLGSSITSTYK